jgi:hypothetical protein
VAAGRQAVRRWACERLQPLQPNDWRIR